MLFTSLTCQAKPTKAKLIKEQIGRIQLIEDENNIKLDRTPEFHDWLLSTGRQQLPMRLEGFTHNLNTNNMDRRLFYIYKYQVGRDRATRQGYIEWLKTVADWFENYNKQ